MSNSLPDYEPDHDRGVHPGAADDGVATVRLSDYECIEDVEMTLAAELGRRMISLRELLRLEVNDVLVFSRPYGENIDVFAGEILLGGAEILARDEKLTVRIADLHDSAGKTSAQPHDSAQAGSGQAQITE
jgi:flagellar motor switch/type III secretory pathway protein FliN